jgi:hypothetical protein
MFQKCDMCPRVHLSNIKITNLWVIIVDQTNGNISEIIYQITETQFIVLLIFVSNFVLLLMTVFV